MVVFVIGCVMLAAAFPAAALRRLGVATFLLVGGGALAFVGSVAIATPGGG